MMRRLMMVAALAGCGPLVTVYSKTTPRRVAVSKQTSRPELAFTAHFIGEDAVELVAKNAYDVRVTRVVHYGAVSYTYGRANPALELIEIPFGFLALALGTTFWESPVLIATTPTLKVEQHTNSLLAMLNPFQTGIAFYATVDPNSNADVFPEPPTIRAFRVSLPPSPTAIAYRALDDDEQVVANGTVATNAFGRATITNLRGAIALEVTIAGKATVVPIAALGVSR